MATINQQMKPWTVPSFAIVKTEPKLRQDGMQTHEQGIPVSALPEATLNEMVGDWLDDIYAKAGKQSPWHNMG